MVRLRRGGRVIDCWRRSGKSIPDYGADDLKNELDQAMTATEPVKFTFDLSDPDVRACLAGNGFLFAF